MSLPKWIAPKEGYKLAWPKRIYVNNLHEALSIAWEALDEATRPTGRYNMDHYEHAKNTIADSIEKAKDAMRRIEEIGRLK